MARVEASTLRQLGAVHVQSACSLLTPAGKLLQQAHPARQPAAAVSTQGRKHRALDCCKLQAVSMLAAAALPLACTPPEVQTSSSLPPCRTPCYGRVYDALPEESRVVRVQLLRPAREGQRRACVLHLAATGEHAFKQRLRLGEPLLAQVPAAPPGLGHRILRASLTVRRAGVACFPCGLAVASGAAGACALCVGPTLRLLACGWTCLPAACRGQSLSGIGPLRGVPPLAGHLHDGAGEPLLRRQDAPGADRLASAARQRPAHPWQGHD